MDADVTEKQMLDALKNAGVVEEVAIHFMRAIMKTTPMKPDLGGTGSDREGARHIERFQRNTGNADPKAAPARTISEQQKPVTFVVVYGEYSLCREAAQNLDAA